MTEHLVRVDTLLSELDLTELPQAYRQYVIRPIGAPCLPESVAMQLSRAFGEWNGWREVA